jgi:cellulose synthase/poly-beta-1,6-N-acetylglucosamine synthase-like glycosyltransferase
VTAALLAVAGAFWSFLAYYTLLLVAGLWLRATRREPPPPARYPSVAVLVPAYNEERVIGGTLAAMTRLEYPGPWRVLVLDDGSRDGTAAIVDAFAEHFPEIVRVVVPPGLPKGKARVLNHGLRLVTEECVAVFDADNRPEPDALRRLVEAMEAMPGAAGAVGYVRTVNASRNALTRMIALEFAVYQLIMQAGRWQLLRLGSLPGTNMVVRRAALEAVGGWDPSALAEDMDLTVRLTVAGWLLPVEPTARTWEQEPETLRVWYRQRTRWVQGNIQVLEKMLRHRDWWRGRALWHTLQIVSVYLVFVALLLTSDAWFVLGLFRHLRVPARLPVLLMWFESFLVYAAQLWSAMVVDGLLEPQNALWATLMYFTYSQAWVAVLARAWWRQVAGRRAAAMPVWEKTVRF